MLALTTSMPTSLPFDLDIGGILADPLIRKILIAAGAVILLALVLRIVGRRRYSAAAARQRAAVRENYEHLRLQQEEIKKLAEKIVATSSTSRIVGFALVRQVETVFSEPRPSSTAAVDLVKALAARKGGNAVINLQTQQMPTGKWVANGDAVLVRAFGRAGERGQKHDGRS